MDGHINVKLAAKKTYILETGGMRTCYPSRRVAAEPLLRRRGQPAQPLRL
jgi:hypothetical protein